MFTAAMVVPPLFDPRAPLASRPTTRTSPTSAPNRYRVNGPLSNLPGFAEAFARRAPAPMIAADRCTVW